MVQENQIISYQNRDYLLRQDVAGDGIHIILSGVIESIYERLPGRKLMLAIWQNGDFVGRPYVVGDHRDNWSARAFGRVESLHLDQAAIRRLLALSPAFATALIECLGCKGESYSTPAQTLSGQKVGKCIALLLAKLCENSMPSDDGSITVYYITRANLARMIGATRRSISLVLSLLQKDGIISVRPQTTVVHDLAALQRQVGK